MKKPKNHRSRIVACRIKNPDKLREKVLKIETKIRDIIDSDSKWDENHRLRDKVEMLLTERGNCLDRMFLATPSEIVRFEALNGMLLHKVTDMQLRASMLWETLLTMKQMKEFDDVYEVRAELKVYGDRSDEESILRLPEDDYYGSDFALANEAIVATMPRHWNHSRCGSVVDPWKTASADKDPDQAFSQSMENGQSWAEGSLCHPALNHICICYPIHDLVTHLNFSIPDLLRINCFKTEVYLEICNETTQSGVRSFEKAFRSWKSDSDIDSGYIHWLDKS